MSYRTYSYAELMLITDLCLFRSPVGVTKLILIFELMLILDLCLFESPVGVIELILIRPEKFQFLEKWKNRNFGQKSGIYSLDLG